MMWPPLSRSRSTVDRRDCWFEVCVDNWIVPSVELVEVAPVPPIQGRTILPNGSKHRPTPATHLHFGPLSEPVDSSPTEILEHTVGFLRQNETAFRRYRLLTPFWLASECSFESELDLLIESAAFQVLARLRMSIDLDLYWKNDEHFIEHETPDTPFPYGRAVVSVDDTAVMGPLDASREFGRLVPHLARYFRMEHRLLTFDVRGGCGRPVTHFSINAVRLLARSGANVRLRVRPEASF